MIKRKLLFSEEPILKIFEFWLRAIYLNLDKFQYTYANQNLNCFSLPYEYGYPEIL